MTSATGSWTDPIPRVRRFGAARGFTLLEVLVVLVLIGIIFSFAVLSVGDGGQSARLQQEAQRLSELIRLGREEAILQGRELAVAFREDGYLFERHDRTAGWTPVSGDEIFRPRRLAEGLQVSAVLLDGTPIALEMLEEQEEQPPRLYLLASGEITPFEITLGGQDGEQAYRVTGQGNGELRVEGPLEAF